MFMVNVMQRIISEEEHDRMIFMEDIIDEDVVHAHVEEEGMLNSPP